MEKYLEYFQKKYIDNNNCILISECIIKNITNLKKYNRFIKNFQKIKVLNDNQYIIGLIHKNTGEILSTLFITVINKEIPFIENSANYRGIQWSYAYTLDDDMTRRKGLSTILRNFSIYWATEENMDYDHSIPFKGAYSNNIVNKFGLKKYTYYDTDNYFSKLEDIIIK